MIGQKRLKDELNYIWNARGLPRFIILTGQRGQGKKTLAYEIAKSLSYTIIPVEIKVDDIRTMIDTAYKQTSPTIYLIADADDMSLGAKNSLLKIIEEPPQQAYFIMTLKQIENTLDTIKSRAYVFNLQEYDYNEKQEMIKKLLPNASLEENQVLNKFDNYYQMQKVIDYGVIEFADYVEKVFDNIYKVQSANSFKLAEKLDLKNDGNGYDLELFWQQFMNVGLAYLFEYNFEQNWDKGNEEGECCNITSKYKKMLSTKGINRQMLVDNWILDIRKVWLQNDKNRD